MVGSVHPSYYHLKASVSTWEISNHLAEPLGATITNLGSTGQEGASRERLNLLKL